MTFKELIENAHLDALGLLEADEEVAFDAAFYAASPHVRAQVRSEQARWSRMDATLPQMNPGDFEPGPHLREMVLERIREAISADQGRLTTLASGRRAWHRTGMIALATAALAFGAAFFTVSSQNRRMASDFQKNRELEGPLMLLRNGQVTKDMLASAETVRIAFSPVDETFRGEACLWVHPKWEGEARLIFSGIPLQEGHTLRLAIVDATNKVVRELTTSFASDGSLALESVDVTSVAAGVRIAIIDVASGQSVSSGVAVLSAAFVRA